MVFDSFSPIRSLPNDPAMIQILRHYAIGATTSPAIQDIEIKFEEYGVIDDNKESWKKFLEDRIHFMYTQADGIPDLVMK